MIARFRLGVDKLPHQVVEALNTFVDPPIARSEWLYKDGDPEDADEYLHINSWSEHEGDLERVLQLVPSDARVEVAGLAAAPLQDLAKQLRALHAKLDAFNGASCPDGYVNHKVQVHVPGNALLQIDQVIVEQDACTDALNEQLARGWRIVAVCPQPDRRRPDYVLGRRCAPL